LGEEALLRFAPEVLKDNSEAIADGFGLLKDLTKDRSSKNSARRNSTRCRLRGAKSFIPRVREVLDEADHSCNHKPMKFLLKMMRFS
jgi:hypothetical protein